MFDKFLFLVCSLFAVSAAAMEPVPDVDSSNVNVTGFIYNTTFSQKSFHDPRTVVAMNVDADFGRTSARLQVGNFDNPVRRAVIEYAFPATDKLTNITQVGRFGRVDSFYNGVLDSPSSYQMAILPLAGYSYRMINGSFVMMDGVQNLTTYRTKSDELVSFRVAYGKMHIPSQRELQKEAFKTSSSDFEMKPTGDNLDVGVHYETGKWHLYAARNHFSTDQHALNTSSTARYVSTNFSHVDYIIHRIGVQYKEKDWFVRGEHSQGLTKTLSTSGRRTGELRADDWNIVLGRHIGPYTLYAGRSLGLNQTANTMNQDNFVGVTYNWKSMTVSLDYHRGSGRGWMKYDNPSPDHRWDTFVLSTTVKF